MTAGRMAERTIPVLVALPLVFGLKNGGGWWVAPLAIFGVATVVALVRGYPITLRRTALAGAIALLAGLVLHVI